MIPLDFHYLWPAGAYLILFSLVVLFSYSFLNYYRLHIPFNRNLIEDRSKRLFWLKSFLASLIVAFCAIALMQPVGNARYPEGTIPPQIKSFTQPLELKRKAHEFIFLIDASASMEIKDTRLQISRLEYAKSIADELIASLTGETASLFAFTSQPFLLSPATLDYIFVRLSLKEIEINEGGIPGTSLLNIIAEIQKRYFLENRSSNVRKLKTVVLLSDGGDTDIEALSGDEKRNKIRELSQMLKDASEQKLRLYTIGIGSTSGGIVPNVTDHGHPVESRLDREILEALAKSGSGRYFEANNYSPFQLAKALLEDVAKDPPYYETTQTEIENALLQSLLTNNNIQYDRYYQIPIGLALLCLAFILFIPDRLTKFFVIMIMISSSFTLLAEEDDLPYQSAMYQAKGFVEAKMFREARDIYENLQNSQVSAFQKAALEYNIGTTYLDEQVWDQAIAKLSPLTLQSTSLKSLDNKIHKNLALSLYGKAISLDEHLPIEILKSLEAALAANSFLPIEQREPLQDTLKQLISKMYLIIDQQHIESEPIRESLQKVYNHLDDLQKVLPLLSMPDASRSLITIYTNFFSSEQQPWLTFWKGLENKLKLNKTAFPLAQEIEPLLKELKNEIQYDNIAKVIQLTHHTKEKLSAIMDVLARDPVEEKLLQLLNSFKRLLARRSWKAEEWADLNQFYTSLQKLELKPDIKLAIINSQHRLEQALETSKARTLPEAKLFAENAIEWIKIALASIPETSSMHLLETLIEQQQDALNLTKLQSSTNLEIPKNLTELIQNTQSGVLFLSNLYYPRVYKEQKEAFNKKGLCQAIPWGAALPLFDEGKEAALKANQNIPSEKTLALQNQAIQAWQKAWVEIKNPTSQHSSCSEGGRAKNEPSPASQESLSTLLQMELDDRKPPIPVPTSIEVKRPW